MNRWEILNDLRRFAHPTWYHDLANRKTETLRALLEYYREGKAIDFTFSYTIGSGKRIGEFCGHGVIVTKKLQKAKRLPRDSGVPFRGVRGSNGRPIVGAEVIPKKRTLAR